ncbi:fibronectin type III domain-containing protein [Eubacterium sp. F2]|uniref:fibronectin type III domain-containing protein n=1 Tax=Eubacterium sp. F2 TaxID=3381348 RepID=UPI0039083A21
MTDDTVDGNWQIQQGYDQVAAEKFTVVSGSYSADPSPYVKNTSTAQATVTNGNSTTYAVGEEDIQKAAEDSSNAVTITKGSVSLTGANAKIVNDASNKGTVTVDGTTVKAGDSVQPNAAQTIANLKSEIASLKSQLAQAQASASSAQSTSNDSARQITQLKKDLADAQAQLKTAQEQAASQGSTLTAPAKITKLKVKAGKRSAKLTWTALKDNATGYRIYRKTKGGKYAKVKTITKASTASWTNKGLKKGKTYYYKVRAYKSITSGELWGTSSNTAKAKVK